MNIIENFNDGLIKGLEKKLDVTKKNLDSSIDETANNLQNNLTSVLGPDGGPGLFDPLNKLLFNLLIKPFDKSAVLTHRDNNTFKIIGMFILLVIESISNLFFNKTVEPVISLSEKAIGYKSDGRRIGPERQPSPKIPLLMKILKTVLGVFASLLDLILMAFTNQVDVFTTIVRDLLGK